MMTRGWIAVIIAMHILFALLAWYTREEPFIEFLRGMLLAVGFGISVAFFGVFLKITLKKIPRRGDTLSIGILLTWYGSGVVSLWALWWRLSGKPLGGDNTDIISYGLFMQICGGILTLLQPEELTVKLPPTQMTRVGGACATAGAIFLVLFVLDRAHMIEYTNLVIRYFGLQGIFGFE